MLIRQNEERLLRELSLVKNNSSAMRKRLFELALEAYEKEIISKWKLFEIVFE